MAMGWGPPYTQCEVPESMRRNVTTSVALGYCASACKDEEMKRRDPGGRKTELLKKYHNAH